MSQIQSDKLYVLKGKTLKELKDRKVIGKLGEIAVDTDKKGNTILSLAGEKINFWVAVNGALAKYEFQAKLKEIAT